jgi:hypothetical protein
VPEILYEVTRIQQKPGEPRRRWFFSHGQDLLIWFGDDGEPSGFQLCYGKYRNERAIRWKVNRGFNHYSVDDGESGAVHSETPILREEGHFAASQVLQQFIELSEKIPGEIVGFVAARLREHPDFRRAARPGLPLSGAAAIGLVLSLVAVALLIVRPRRSPVTSHESPVTRD